MSVGSFTVAVNDSYTAKSGDKKESVAFIDCKAWGKTAENMAKFLNKGSAVLVEGKIKQDNWEDKDGNKRSKLYINVDSFAFVGGKGEKPAAEVEPKASSDDSETIPF
jgi:single-strand DNA-binding protein